MARIQAMTGPEQAHGDYNHVDLDDPELIGSADDGRILVQIAAPDGRVLNASGTLRGTLLPPGYVGPPVLSEVNGQPMIIAGERLAGGALVQVARPVGRERAFLRMLAGVISYSSRFCSLD